MNITYISKCILSRNLLANVKVLIIKCYNKNIKVLEIIKLANITVSGVYYILKKFNTINILNKKRMCERKLLIPKNKKDKLIIYVQANQFVF